MIDVREATPEDNDALIELQRKCPQGTSLVLVMERSPDYFARPHSFEDGHTYVATAAGDIVGVVEFAVRELDVRGVPVKALYEFSLGVDPLSRRKGVATALHGAVEEYARQNGVDLIHLNIIEGNEPSMRLAGSLGFKRAGAFKIYLMMVYEERGLNPGSRVRRAEVEDLEAVSALINETYRGYDFFKPYTWSSLMDYVERLPGFSLDDLYVIEDERGIRACLGYWEYDRVLQFIVEGLTLRHKALATLMGVLGVFMNVPRIPALGEKVSQVFLTPIAYRDALSLGELIKFANNRALGSGVHYLSGATDVDGPLSKVYSSFRHTDTVGHVYVKSVDSTLEAPKREGPLFVDMTDI